MKATSTSQTLSAFVLAAGLLAVAAAAVRSHSFLLLSAGALFVVLAATFVLVLLVSIADSRRTQRDVLQAMQQATLDGRLAIYDSRTGLLATWYFRLRVGEECLRCKRYGRVVSLLVAQLSEVAKIQFEQWLQAGLRETDLLCLNADGSYYVLLIETNESGAAEVANRIRAINRRAKVSVAMFPEREARFLNLMEPIEKHFRAA